jgi:hypothetical protein
VSERRERRFTQTAKPMEWCSVGWKTKGLKKRHSVRQESNHDVRYGSRPGAHGSPSN